MIAGTTRTHVVLPEELLREVDELVGPRQRSQFFADAAREKLARARLLNAARKAAGSLAGVDVPGWGSSDEAAAWVHDLRRAADASVSANDAP